MSRKSNKRSEEREDDTKEIQSRTGSKRRTRNSASRRTRKSNDRDTRAASVVASKDDTANDVTWYTKSMEQVNNVANISFMSALGVPLNTFPLASDVTKFTSSNVGAPGVMVCNYMPTFGNPQQAGDPMNVAAQKTYAYVRYYNSGSRNYFAPDLMKYIAVMDSAYAYAGYLIRLYGLANAFNAVNRYWPLRIFEALNVDYSTLLSDLAGFRTYVNNYISKINSLAVPAALPIFARHFWMCSNVYRDAPNDWSQVYVNRPIVYAKYNQGSGDVGFYRLGTRSTGTPDTISYFKTVGDAIINSIMETEDFNIMSGDIIKAFGNNVFRVEAVDHNFVLYPVYDAGVLNQIMNSFAIGEPTSDTGAEPGTPDQYFYGLIEDPNETGFLKLGRRKINDPSDPSQDTFRFKLVTGDVHKVFDNAGLAVDFNNFKHIINLTVDQPTPLHVIESTRLTAVTHIYGQQSDDPAFTSTPSTARIYQVLDACGADVYCSFAFIYSYGTLGNLTFAQSTPFSSLFTLDATSPSDAVTMMQDVSFLTSFDWHPILYPIIKTSATAATYVGPFVDMYRTASVSKEVLARIHEVANLSLFDVTLENSLNM